MVIKVNGHEDKRSSKFSNLNRTDYNHVSRGGKAALYFHVPCNSGQPVYFLSANVINLINQ